MASSLRLSRRFVPTQKAASSDAVDLASLSLLLRGGYIRQSSSGVYTLLPNGLRLVSKVERIIDQEMESIGASRLAMPTLLPSLLWKRTGRYEAMGSELYKLRDRRGSEFVLAPTHEEEVTRLVAGEVESDKQLPVRVYQITRKHRDEPRPRMGLLRTREFLMKDLYTFDADVEQAEESYKDVREAYKRVFDRIFGAGAWKCADADSGAIGGSSSHEYHLEDAAGEDTLLSCSRCEYTANEEKAASMPAADKMPASKEEVAFLLYGSESLEDQQQTLHALAVPKQRTVNKVKLEKHLSKIANGRKMELLYDSSTGQKSGWDWADRPEGPLIRFERLELLLDFECTALEHTEVEEGLIRSVVAFASPHVTEEAWYPELSDLFPGQFDAAPAMPPLTLVDVRTAEHGDTCPSCRTVGALQRTRAIEVGHTFLLGDKYSRALEAGYLPAPGAEKVGQLANGRLPFQMGCYGIGVSRILGALAQRAAKAFDQLAPKPSLMGKGFVWPHEVTPFEAVVITTGGEERDAAALQVYEALTKPSVSVRSVLERALGLTPSASSPPVTEQQVVIDDRAASLGSKLADADLSGYPVRIILGTHFTNTREVEVRVLSTLLSHAGPAKWETHYIGIDKL